MPIAADQAGLEQRHAIPVNARSGWAPAAPLAAFGDVNIALPPGATVAKTETDGGRLIVHLALAGGGTILLFISGFVLMNAYPAFFSAGGPLAFLVTDPWSPLAEPPALGSLKMIVGRGAG